MRITDRVVVALTVVLSVVGGVRAVPRRCVVRASEDAIVAILVQDISHEELTEVWVRHGRETLLYIKRSLGVTGGGANRWIVWLRLGECLDSHVSRWCVDSTGTKVDGSREAINGGRFGSLIDVGASDNDLEIVLPLSSVGSRRGAQDTSEDGALDVSG